MRTAGRKQSTGAPAPAPAPVSAPAPVPAPLEPVLSAQIGTKPQTTSLTAKEESLELVNLELQQQLAESQAAQVQAAKAYSDELKRLQAQIEVPQRQMTNDK